MTAEPTPKVKSLYKALHLLDYFDQDHPDAGVTELAEYSGLLKSSVHNILQTFELCGYVTQSSETSRYMLGGAAVSLFSRFKATRKIDYRITEYLQSLRDMFHKNAETLTAYTPQTITDPDALRAELERVIYDGYATSAAEYQDGIYCIAVPVIDGYEPVRYAIGIGSDSPISPYQRKQYLSELRYVAKKVASIVSGKW